MGEVEETQQLPGVNVIRMQEPKCNLFDVCVTDIQQLTTICYRK